MPPTIESLTVEGFRAYGAIPQTLNLPRGIAVVWGPNSTGKSSLAEAFEFLLTGRIVRRQLMASSVDEFADALRNAHLPEGDDVIVSARITAPDGTDHVLRRVLVSDYSKKQECTSRLEIDGVRATGDDLAKLGFTFSQPPMQAPVLTQDTLGYIFFVRPTDRATYFKTLLEVTDLDALRTDIAGLADELRPPDAPFLRKLDRCASLPTLATTLGSISTPTPQLATLTAGLSEGARTLIDSAGEVAPETFTDRISAIERVLSDRRSETFPIHGFARRELAGWNNPEPEIWAAIDRYLCEKQKVADQTRQLTALFSKALELPMVAGMAESVDCPLCGAEAALTPVRVHTIREHVSNTDEFNKAESAARKALAQIYASVNALSGSIRTAVPQHLNWARAKRRDAGFTISRMRDLLKDGSAELVRSWLAAVPPLVRERARLSRTVGTACALLQQQTDTMDGELDPPTIHRALEELTASHASFTTALKLYGPPAHSLVSALKEVIDAKAETVGWQDFVDICLDPAELRTALVEQEARAIVNRELKQALQQIDRAKEHVLDDKFTGYSDLVQRWWERLRPDGTTFFSSVGPSNRTRRTIDFKAGLAPDSDRSESIVRDVIAVFSQSQLHCLGLALFLARVQHEKLRFIVLDDPILASDDDYRVHFNTAVLGALRDLGIQVVVLTQSHDTLKDLEILYRHIGISTAQIFADRPGEGSIIDNTSDALLAKITRAKSLARGGHPDCRKECGIHLRDAGERFCKEMLVKLKHAEGNPLASLTDYDGKTMEQLLPRVSPLLDPDPSHPGRLTMFKTTANQACHDNAPPSVDTMNHACGEIMFLQEEYLRR